MQDAIEEVNAVIKLIKHLELRSIPVYSEVTPGELSGVYSLVIEYSNINFNFDI